jgi:uncharacterized protein YkwD
VGTLRAAGQRRWAVAFAAALALVLWSAFGQADELDSAPDPIASISGDLVALTNADRVSNGLPALSVDSPLSDLALDRSGDMAQREYFSHEIPPTGQYVFDLMRDRGIKFETAGENIEFNTASGTQSLWFAQRDFMNSPSHRTLILDDTFSHVGTGAAVSTTDRKYYTVLFTGDGGEYACPTDGCPLPDVEPVCGKFTAAGCTVKTLPKAELLAKAPAGVIQAPAAVAQPPKPSAPRLLQPAGRRSPGIVEAVVGRVVRSNLGLGSF